MHALCERMAPRGLSRRGLRQSGKACGCRWPSGAAAATTCDVVCSLTSESLTWKRARFELSLNFNILLRRIRMLLLHYTWMVYSTHTAAAQTEELPGRERRFWLYYARVYVYIYYIYIQ